ncbi:hypothetical protein P7C71_g3691, partial [Lecanoromycetidae sp. Uapishka_2]
MKVILTGSSGFIGAEILSQCLSHPSITSIIALSRRELPISDPKLKTIILSDFTSYPASLLSQLGDAEACIYALGTVSLYTPDLSRRVNMDYTLAAANAFAASLAPQIKESRSQNFRLVYCSGYLTERDQERSLWLVGEDRRMRGLLEVRLEELGVKQAESGFEILIARPAFVFAKGSWFRSMAGAVVQTIAVDELAAAMIGIALEGSKNQVCQNGELVSKGRELSRKT